MAKGQQRYIIRSVSRALELLQTFSGAESGLSLAEISRRLNLNRSTTFRLLVTLPAHGYVEEDRETRKYRLGVSCLELGSVLRLAGSEVVYLEKLDGLLPIGIMGSRVGGRAQPIALAWVRLS